MTLYPKKILILGLSLESKNMGVGALGAGIMSCAVKAYPEADIFVLDYGKVSIRKTYKIEGRKKDVQLVNMRFSKKLYLKNNIAMLMGLAILARTLPLKNLRRYIYEKNSYLKIIHEADIIGAISGGDSFSDIYGLKRFYYVALPQLLILLMQKKLILLPQTLGPFQRRMTAAIAHWIMDKASLVFSRDEEDAAEAKALLRQEGGSGKIRFFYDVGFAVEPIQPIHIDIVGLDRPIDNNGLVGLNISGLLYMGGYTLSNMFKLKIDYPKFVNELVAYIIENKGLRVLLIPHVFGSGLDSESDEIVCHKVYDALCDKYPGRLGCLQGEHDQSEIKYVIGTCNFFIGSRMHACIAAVSQCIPSVSIAYSKKFYGVMDTVGMGEYVADPRTMAKEDILAMIGKAYDERDALRIGLEKRMSDVKGSVQQLFQTIWEQMQKNDAVDVS